jgi:hypothetical protein
MLDDDAHGMVVDENSTHARRLSKTVQADDAPSAVAFKTAGQRSAVVQARAQSATHPPVGVALAVSGC